MPGAPATAGVHDGQRHTEALTVYAPACKALRILHLMVPAARVGQTGEGPSIRVHAKLHACKQLALADTAAGWFSIVKTRPLYEAAWLFIYSNNQVTCHA